MSGLKEIEMQQIIEAVTRQVLASMGTPASVQSQPPEPKPRYLVVGDTSCVPAKLSAGGTIEGIDSYQKCADITQYSKVIITSLDLVQLADIAQARPSCPECCAVVQALLNGIDVELVESGIPHRKFAGKSSPGLYTLLESYVETILGFGVKLMGESRLTVSPIISQKTPRYDTSQPLPVKGSAKINPSRLITERDAIVMASQAQDTVYLEAGTIITPSALDIFRRAGLSVERAGG